MKPIDVLVQRMVGLHLSDRNTPLIGPYASAVMATYGKPEECIPDLAGYYAELTRANQFPNENVSGWMEAFWQARCPELMLDLHQEHLAACALDPSLFLRPPLFFRPVQVVTRPEMVTDALSVEEGKPFPMAVPVTLTPDERADLRQAVDDAGKSGSLKVESAMVPVGVCHVCAKQYLAPLLSDLQRKNFEAGLPFRCRKCLPGEGNCMDCGKTTKVGDLGFKQRERLETGKPFRCRPCAVIAKEKYDAKGKAEASPPLRKG